MTHVLILEDDKVSMDALTEILTNYIDDVCIHTAFSFPEAVRLLNIDIQYGLFLLDVNLSGEDKADIGGILFAREIRERIQYHFTPIVMVTAIGAMEMQAYRELHCYQYIMKPFLPDEVREVVEKVLEKEKREEPASVMVKKGGVNYQVQCRDILYIEAVPRGIRLHMKTADWDVPYLTLKQLLSRLPKEMFLQCHRMFAVNRHEVEYYDTVNRIIKLKGCADFVDIGVTYKQEIGRLVHDG